VEAQIGVNRALILTTGDKDSYECVLGEYPTVVPHGSSLPTMRPMYYAEFPAYSAALAAFMARCGFGEEFSRFERGDALWIQQDDPKWVPDYEEGIAYYLTFKMRGLTNEHVRHVLFATHALHELEHFLAKVLLAPRPAYRLRSTSSRPRIGPH
jgi:hypothetical protein